MGGKFFFWVCGIVVGVIVVVLSNNWELVIEDMFILFEFCSVCRKVKWEVNYRIRIDEVLEIFIIVFG